MLCQLSRSLCDDTSDCKVESEKTLTRPYAPPEYLKRLAVILTADGMQDTESCLSGLQWMIALNIFSGCEVFPSHLRIPDASRSDALH